MRVRAVALASMVGLLALAGCQLLLTDASEIQCTVNSDCAARGFAFAVCNSGTCQNPSNFCTSSTECPPKEGENVACEENQCKYTPRIVCTKDSDCAATFPGKRVYCQDNACFARPDDYCESNAECAGKSDAGTGAGPAICVNKACKPLLSEDCTGIIGTKDDYLRDDVVVYGFLMNITGASTVSVGLGSLGSLVLGREHFYNTFKGLPSGTGSSARPRPFIYVVCNEFVDPARATKHLVEDLKVPAILGPEISDNTFNIAQNITIPAGVAVLTPASTTGALASLQGGLTFRNFGTDDDFMAVYQEIVNQKQVSLTSAGIVAGNTLKVGVFHKGETTGTYLATNLRAKLTFNAQSGQANSDANLMKSFNYGYGPGQTQAQSDAQTATAIDQIVAYQPHLIFLPGSGEVFPAMQQIEAKWATVNAALTYKPFYIPYSAAAGFNWKAWMSLPGNDTIRQRVLFPSHQLPPPGDTTAAAVQSQAVNEFNTKFPGGFQLAWLENQSQPNTDAGSPATGTLTSGGPLSSYDNGHLIPLASIHSMAANKGQVTGAGIAAGLRSFGAGGVNVAITATPQGPLTDAVTAIQKGEKVQYYGINGIIAFDATGTTHTPVQMRCVGATPNFATTAAGLFFNSGGSGQLSGACNAACSQPSGPCW